jgi:signal peptidase I
MTSATDFTSGSAPSGVRGRVGIAHRVQSALQTLWFVVIPALLAIVAVRFLVPRAAPGVDGALGIVARVGHGVPLVLGALLFVVFSALTRYWRFRLPGGRFLSALPANLASAASVEQLPGRATAASLHRWLSAPATRRSLQSPLSDKDRAQVEVQVGALWQGLETGDDERVQAAVSVLERLTAPALATRWRRETVGLTVTVAMALGAVLLLRAKVAEPYSVLSASMLPTLEPGDEVIGNKLAYRATSPRRGDVVVFPSAAVALREVDAPPRLMKRIIGLQGDHIQMHGGLPVINGWEVPTCDVAEYIYPLPDGQGGAVHGRLLLEFLDDRAYLTVHVVARAFLDDYQVQPGEVFVLGDNRGNSIDSRAWNEGHGGGVPVSALDGRAQWFLVGTHLDGRADWQRALRPLGAALAPFHAEGFDVTPIDEGIAKCLRDRPKETHPPPPDAPRALTPAPMQGGGL